MSKVIKIEARHRKSVEKKFRDQMVKRCAPDPEQLRKHNVSLLVENSKLSEKLYQAQCRVANLENQLVLERRQRDD